MRLVPSLTSLVSATFLAAAMTVGNGLAAAELTAGDIALVGINTDSPDTFGFVALTTIAAGTTISFTDNGWKQGGGISSGEDTAIWTAPAAGLAAGAVVTVNGTSATKGTMSGSLNSLSASGESIIAYTGSASAPVMIFALNDNGSGWQSDASTSNDSALPTGLVNGTTAVALSEKDNYGYNGITSGTKAALLAAIANKANWSGSDSSAKTWPASFNVTDAGGGTGGGGTGTGLPGVAKYTGTADGSAGVHIDATYFLNFDDETNYGRLYQTGTAAAPAKTYNLTSSLGLSAEADFEDALKLGSDVYLISSHGRNKSGVYESDRYRFARLAIGGSGTATTVSVGGYTKNLVQNLVKSANWTTPDAAVIALIEARTKLGTSTVANLAPKVDGFNIEGLGLMPNGTHLAIGLRNPLINNKAIVVTLENPAVAATTSGVPRFGQAFQLDLGGLGVRALAWSTTYQKMFIVAGHTTADAGFKLYAWSGTSAQPIYLTDVSHSSGGSIEAILPHEGTTFLRLLVDEGSVLVNGVENKAQSPSAQFFHDTMIDLTALIAKP